MKSKKEGPSTGSPSGGRGRPLVPAGSRAVAPQVQADGAIVERDGPATLVTGRAYATETVVVPADAIYDVDGLKPDLEGPWLGEADKVAWRDPATGYDCIMMRADGGNLCGYVGLPRSHPLYGWEHKAIPAELGVEVHGGITYSRICRQGPSPKRSIRNEARSICHVPIKSASGKPITQATDYRPEDTHAWWLGFECDGDHDVVPGDPNHGKRAADLGIRQVYRDHDYVLREVLKLAAKLREVEDSASAPTRSGPTFEPNSEKRG